MAVRVPTQWLLTLVLIGTGLVGLRTSHAAAAPAYADNVVIIMVDGLRPDALKQAKVPTLDGLIKRGASTMKAQTVEPSLTLPAFASMMSGLPVAQHGVDWNEYDPPRGFIKSPTLFEIASFNGSKWGAAFLNKEKLLHVIKQDRRLLLNVCSSNEPGCNAKKITGDVIASYKTATEGKPALFVVQLADADTAGHDQGWMSKPYLKAVEDVDRGIGSLTKGFKELGLFDRTTFIVTSDHGGHAKTHGTSMAEDMTIPWIAAGPGIKAGYEIKQPVSLIDTAATVMRAFGITDYYVEWKSRSIDEIFVDRAEARRPQEPRGLVDDVPDRVDRRAVELDFVMEVGTGREPRVPDFADDVSPLHGLAIPHSQLGQMRVQGLEAIAVRHHNHVAQTLLRPDCDDGAGRRRLDRRAHRRGNIQPAVHHVLSREWGHAAPES